MSAIREGTCAEPGPYGQHCTEDLIHRYSHYDAGEDSSWNHRSPQGWQTESPHQCQEKACRSFDDIEDSPYGSAYTPQEWPAVLDEVRKQSRLR